MGERQEIVEVSRAELLERVRRLERAGYRLVQIGCTRLDEFQIDYSFDRDHRFINLRLSVPGDRVEIPSISGIYWTAFTYENEIHDLFGVEVEGLKIDYEGNFYRIALRAPFDVRPQPPKEGVDE